MNRSEWIFDPVSQQHHHPECNVWDWQNTTSRCNCSALEDELIENFQKVKPYTRTVTVPQTDPNAPHQSLASLIRAARRAGHLRPLQPYGGGRTPAFQP